MKIKSMSIQNFRAYKEETKIDFDDMTAFVGKNDIGKSSILEALDIFFNSGKSSVALDQTDINVESNKMAGEHDDEIRIAVTFSELPENVILDDTAQTTLSGEYLLNDDGCLEIVKIFKPGKKTNNEKVFIRAMHPTNADSEELLLKKNAELKRIVDNHDIKCDDRSCNPNLRKAIWDHFKKHPEIGGLGLNLIEIDVSSKSGDMKAIWEKLSDYLPSYSLFQADRKNVDTDSEVQDPLKAKVKEILSQTEIIKQLDKIAYKVKKSLEDVSIRTMEKLKEMDNSIATSLNPKIPSVSELKWFEVFKNVSIASDEDIPLNKRGSGTKRLILLNFFRAEAERRQNEEGAHGVVYAIEEPETSQHTLNQKMLINALLDLSKNNDVQVIITTHSPIVVNCLEQSNIRVVTIDQGKRFIKKAEKRFLPNMSLHEICYIAFSDVTIAYHDELYGYIQETHLLKEYESREPNKRKYIRMDKHGNRCNPEQVCLSTYIRHQIHHPENKYNTKYKEDELRQSISDMCSFLESKKTSEALQQQSTSSTACIGMTLNP